MKKHNQVKAVIKKLGYLPEAIMINVPEAFFLHNGRIQGDREQAFRRFYERMGKDGFEQAHFNHFISTVPVVEGVTHVYVCFRGFVQYKAILVAFLKDAEVQLDDGSIHPAGKRDWCVTTGPVEKAPEGLVQKGFRGYRYCKELF